MAKKFTDALIKAQKPRASRYDIREGDGFALRVFPSGKRSFFFVYDFGGQRRRLTLGAYGDVTLKEARKRHAEAKAMLAGGQDPASDKSKRTADLRSDPTLRQLFDRYTESDHFTDLADSSRREYRRSIEKYVLPSLGATRIADLERKQFANLYERLRKRSGPVAATRTIAYTRAMLSYAVSAQLLEVNPCRGIGVLKRRGKKKGTTRERVLDAFEIRRFWFTLDDLPIAPVIRLALRMLLTTAQRRGELLQARWEYVDLEKRTLTFPGSTTKSGHPHPIPLSPLAFAILEELQELRDGGGWLFPSTTRPGTHIRPDSVTRIVSLHRGAFGIEERFTVHDLRRTAATMMAKSGAHRDYLRKILNHADSEVTSIYDRYAAVEEQRQFLDAWGEELRRIIDPTHVLAKTETGAVSVRAEAQTRTETRPK